MQQNLFIAHQIRSYLSELQLIHTVQNHQFHIICIFYVQSQVCHTVEFADMAHRELSARDQKF